VGCGLGLHFFFENVQQGKPLVW
jgi:hypothetical protein